MKPSLYEMMIGSEGIRQPAFRHDRERNCAIAKCR